MTHQFTVKIYVEDTDYGGIVYHANYLKYMERARTEWLNSIDLSLRDMQQHNTLFVARTATLHFHKPAFLNDTLIIETTVTRIKNTRLIFKHRIVKKDTPGIIICCNSEVEVVCVNLEKKAVRLPSIILNYLEENA